MEGLRITIDPALPSHILAFHQRLPVGNASKRMSLIAAAAVRAEAELVESVGGVGKVSYGLTVEQFLRHVEKNEKQAFLEAVEEVLAAWREAPPSLVIKFKEIKHTYRVFIHYRSLFAALSSSLGLS